MGALEVRESALGQRGVPTFGELSRFPPVNMPQFPGPLGARGFDILRPLQEFGGTRFIGQGEEAGSVPQEGDIPRFVSDLLQPGLFRCGEAFRIQHRHDLCFGSLKHLRLRRIPDEPQDMPGLAGGIGPVMPKVVPQELRPRVQVLRVRREAPFQFGGLRRREVPALQRLLPQVLGEARGSEPQERRESAEKKQTVNRHGAPPREGCEWRASKRRAIRDRPRAPLESPGTG